MKNSGNRYNNSIKHIKHELRTVKSAIYKYNAQLKSINFHNRSSLQEHFNVIQSSLINTACRMEKILNDMADVQANIINNQSHSDGTNIGVEKQDPNYIKATQKSVIGRKNIDQRYSSQIDEESMAFPDEQEQQQQQQQKQETMPTVQMKGLMYNNAAAMINDNLSDFTEITNRFQQLGQNHEQLNQIIAEQAETIVRIDDYVHNANVNLVNTRSELLNFMAEQVKDRCFVVKLVVIISIFFIIYLKMAK
ncbi:MAG: Syntaxin-5, variant 2 [Marteilia pararefringens]